MVIFVALFRHVILWSWGFTWLLHNAPYQYSFLSWNDITIKDKKNDIDFSFDLCGGEILMFLWILIFLIRRGQQRQKWLRRIRIRNKKIWKRGFFLEVLQNTRYVLLLTLICLSFVYLFINFSVNICWYALTW